MVDKRRKTAAVPPAAPREDARIAKVMARAGLCSRREAEAWIEAGRVAVNGTVLTSPAFNVTPRDAILVDGEPLRARERTRLFLFHKPRGLVTTDRDPEGRATIFSALPATLPRVVTVGRLDINTEGLLLLTNDGGLARVLELPSTGWLRRYRVRANGTTDQTALDRLRDGVTVEGVAYGPIEAVLDRAQGANVWLTLGLREGKNREVKKVLEHLGLAVNRLIRLSFGPFQLGDLAEGAVEEVRTRVIRDQLGAELAAEAGADFDAPLQEAATQRPESSPRPPRPPGKRPAPRRATDDRSGDGRRDDRRRGNDRRSAVREADPPKRRKPVVGPRKHVSVLRKEGAADQADRPRTRIERSATEDRRGRSVAVERVMKARPDGRGTERIRPSKPRTDRVRDEARRGPTRGEARRPSRPFSPGGAPRGKGPRGRR